VVSNSVITLKKGKQGINEGGTDVPFDN
jgi:hypothetical protein